MLRRTRRNGHCGRCGAHRLKAKVSPRLLRPSPCAITSNSKLPEGLMTDTRPQTSVWPDGADIKMSLERAATPPLPHARAHARAHARTDTPSHSPSPSPSHHWSGITGELRDVASAGLGGPRLSNGAFHSSPALCVRPLSRYVPPGPHGVCPGDLMGSQGHVGEARPTHHTLLIHSGVSATPRARVPPWTARHGTMTRPTKS